MERIGDVDKANMKTKYSRYYFRHLLLYFEPDVFVLPFAFWIDNTAIQFSCLCFSAVWYFNKQDMD